MPDILPPESLALLRGVVRDLAMPGTAHILRGTTVPDGLGGWTQTFGTVSVGGTVNMPCRFRPSGAGELSSATRESSISGRLADRMLWTVVLPAEWPVNVDDRIAILGAVRTFEVTGILAPKTWEMERKVLCSEVR